MGIVANALLLEKGLRADFMKAYNNGENPSDVAPFIMETTSTSDSEKYGWLGNVPGMVEWKDERQLKGLKDYDYSLENKDYEATLKVNRNAMEDDQLGAVKLRIKDLAIKARTNFPRKLFFEQLAKGTTELCYDGVPFFSASHPELEVDGVVVPQSNIVTGSATGAYTAAQFATDLKAARARIRGFKDDQGEPRNEGELDLMVVAGNDMEGVIDDVLNADKLDNSTNTLRGVAKKLISARVPDGQNWYLIDVSGNLKPFIKQKRKAITFESQEKGERAFMRKELLYGVDERVGFGFGLWSKAVKITN